MSSFDDDIEYADISCPKCGNEMVRRDCNECEDGEIDEYEFDPINYCEGESFVSCSECGGHGAHIWCQKCGWDYLEKRYLNGKSELEPTTEQT